ncbi:hypothetical protein ACFLV2_02570 [Chloroflexota bacterium]
MKINRKTRAKDRAREESGLGLVETLMAVAILGTAIVAFVTALSTGSIAVGQNEEQTVAQGLARSQLEYTKSYPYDVNAITYPTVTPRAGYAVAVAVGPVPGTDTDMQKITVTVSREGQDILNVENYKMNR